MRLRINGPIARKALCGLGIAAVILLFPLLASALYFPIAEWLSYRAARPSFDRHYEQEIIPSAVWVEQFRRERGRLPTIDEHRQSPENVAERWPKGIITAKPLWHNEWGNEGDAFMIVSSVGEWNLYYQSWNQKRWWVWNE